MDRFDEVMREFCESPKVAWLVVVFLFMCLWAVSVGAASMVAQDPLGNRVVVHEEPCDTPEVLAVILEEHRVRFKRAELNYEGKDYKACWALGPDGRVWVVDETKEYFSLPVQMFQRMKDA